MSTQARRQRPGSVASNDSVLIEGLAQKKRRDRRETLETQRIDRRVARDEGLRRTLLVRDPGVSASRGARSLYERAAPEKRGRITFWPKRVGKIGTCYFFG